MKNIFWGFCFLLLFCGILPVHGQTPAQIDVTGIEVYRDSGHPAFNTITVNNLPPGLESPLMGRDGVTIYGLEHNCRCFLGHSFKTDLFPNYEQSRSIVGFYLSGPGGQQYRVKFTIFGTSPDLILSPRIPLKKRIFTVSVTSKITGKMEIFYNENTLVAIDEDVDLTGTIKAEFWQNRFPNERRSFDFRNFTMSYSK